MVQLRENRSTCSAYYNSKLYHNSQVICQHDLLTELVCVSLSPLAHPKPWLPFWMPSLASLPSSSLSGRSSKHCIMDFFMSDLYFVFSNRFIITLFRKLSTFHIPCHRLTNPSFLAPSFDVTVVDIGDMSCLFKAAISSSG